METLSRPFQFPTTHHPRCLPMISHIPNLRPRTSTSMEAFVVSVSRTSASPSPSNSPSPPVSELEDDNLLQTFFKKRELDGDIISKASDIFWKRELVKFADAESETPAENSQQLEEVINREPQGGFLKLTKTHEWVLGLDSAPINNKAVGKGLQDDSHKRKRLNLLEYEAIKREMLLLSVGIGTACTAYCLLTLSVEAAVSYDVGVLFSCLYLQLLYYHADNLCREAVPQIFRQKKSKRIGIRSEELQNFLERTIKGSSIALSSPRLAIPAAIYGLWIFSHQHFLRGFFDFQLVPAMFGMFVYKAAALVQVYRDNEDLQFIFPGDTERSED